MGGVAEGHVKSWCWYLNHQSLVSLSTRRQPKPISCPPQRQISKLSDIRIVCIGQKGKLRHVEEVGVVCQPTGDGIQCQRIENRLWEQRAQPSWLPCVTYAKRLAGLESSAKVLELWISKLSNIWIAYKYNFKLLIPLCQMVSFFSSFFFFLLLFQPSFFVKVLLKELQLWHHQRISFNKMFWIICAGSGGSANGNIPCSKCDF